jgi:hypothetical protein
MQVLTGAIVRQTTFRMALLSGEVETPKTPLAAWLATSAIRIALVSEVVQRRTMAAAERKAGAAKLQHGLK